MKNREGGRRSRRGKVRGSEGNRQREPPPRTRYTPATTKKPRKWVCNTAILVISTVAFCTGRGDREDGEKINRQMRYPEGMVKDDSQNKNKNGEEEEVGKGERRGDKEEMKTRRKSSSRRRSRRGRRRMHAKDVVA